MDISLWSASTRRRSSSSDFSASLAARSSSRLAANAWFLRSRMTSSSSSGRLPSGIAKDRPSPLVVGFWELVGPCGVFCRTFDRSARSLPLAAKDASALSTAGLRFTRRCMRAQLSISAGTGSSSSSQSFAALADAALATASTGASSSASASTSALTSASLLASRGTSSTCSSSSTSARKGASPWSCGTKHICSSDTRISVTAFTAKGNVFLSRYLCHSTLPPAVVMASMAFDAARSAPKRSAP
mmetsp:Transcript_64047/g.139287  ORF Transcript_64047/g.139287 Transcript_64047/m.139287 type:complete len:244 (+) Transcript_64047:1197-1928(+)